MLFLNSLIFLYILIPKVLKELSGKTAYQYMEKEEPCCYMSSPETSISVQRLESHTSSGGHEESNVQQLVGTGRGVAQSVNQQHKASTADITFSRPTSRTIRSVKLWSSFASYSAKHPNHDSEQQVIEVQSGPEEMSSYSDNLAETIVMCCFRNIPINVSFCPAPIKTIARMREKLTEYEDGTWPLCAYILDPVRCSIICNCPEEILDVVSRLLLGVGKSVINLIYSMPNVFEQLYS